MTKLSKSENKLFYYTLITIALPIVIQNIVSGTLNMVDTLMITSLGENAIAAVGIANKLFFLSTLVIFGFYSGAGIFISQFNGINDVEKIKSTVALQLILGVITSIFFSLIAIIFPKSYFSLFTSNPQVIDYGVRYLRIVGFSYVFFSIAFGYIFSYRSIGKTIYPMIVTGFSLCFNTFFNYGLINGNLGMPRLGIEGAAIATLLARLIEFCLIISSVYFFTQDNPIASTLSHFKSIDRKFFDTYFSTSFPVILGESFWGLGIVFYSIAYSKLGTSALASTQVAMTINDLFLILAMGIASGSAVMIGAQLGKNNINMAKLYAKKFSVISFSAGLFTSVLIILTLPLVDIIYKLEPSLIINIKKILITKAIACPFMTFNWCNIVGILRSGGDTKFAMILELSTVWLIGVPMAFIGASVFKLPVYIVSLMISLEELVKSAFGVPRVLSYKWANNLIDTEFYN
ncbi:MAG: MATE family efflux transporter [Filifactoraceae bacterium]